MARVIEQAGVSVAPTGSTGVQVNEFEAAIKSVTSATTIGAVFIYDTRNDSDGGAWRKKCAGLSWYDETLNTATRGGRREFPSVAVIVVDTNATGTLSIFDGDDPSLPLWKSFSAASANAFSGNPSGNYSCVFALNGRIYLGKSTASNTSAGLVVLDFADDVSKNITTSTSSSNHRIFGSIVDAIAGENKGTPSEGAIVNSAVNDVAATYLEGGELDSLGLVRPVVACATNGGVSVIHPNGSVYNQTYSVAINNESNHIEFDNNNGLYWVNRSGAVYLNYLRNTLYATSSAAPDKVYHTKNTGASVAGPTMLGGSTAISSVASMGDDFAAGSTNGLSVVKHNDGNNDEGAVAHITSDYNTGYMLGDIRLATLANSTVDGSTGATMHDRSVKGNNLTEQGNVNQAAVATDAELQYYTNFGSDNYLNRAYSADFNFTNTMSVMFWVKDYTTRDIYGIGTRNSTLSQSIYIDGGYDIRFSLTSDGSTEQQFEIPESGVLDQWTFICFSVNAGAVRGYKNGQNIAASNGTFTGNIFSQATDQEGLEIGKGAIVSEGSSTGKLALFRISATAPTPQQVKEIYEAEKPLFRAGAKCLLQASSDSVLDLSYDKTTDLLSVGHYGTTAGRTDFKNLEAVNTFDGSAHGWSVRTTNLLASNGGVIAQAKTAGTGGVIVDIPPVDVRGDLNTADSKLPDDGKIHFSGVTTNATPTVIGNIPIAENEAIQIITRVEGCRYNQASSSRHVLAEIKQQFYRDFGGNVTARSQASKLVQEGLASLDVDLTVNTTAQTIEVKCTGTVDVPRMQWKAEVQVQRISEKTYER